MLLKNIEAKVKNKQLKAQKLIASGDQGVGEETMEFCFLVFFIVLFCSFVLSFGKKPCTTSGILNYEHL